MFFSTTATKKIKQLRKRIRLIAGGTSASKTISALIYLIAKAQSDVKPTLTSIVSESFPHLRRGAMRDFLNIMQEHGYYKEANWSRTEYTYTFETGSKIEFFSADQSDKVRGPRRDRLFVNEVNNILREAWEQLVIRTREFVIADWNPVADFWIYEDYELDDSPASTSNEDADFLILTYRDNEALEPAIIKEIETRAARNKNWGRVYADGKRGSTEAKIYKNWPVLEGVPEDARLVRRGLDFGYSNDPACLVDIYEYNGGYVLDQRLYRKGMSNKALADFINSLEWTNTMVVADSAEPKSIDELSSYGIVTMPAMKGPGSLNQGIQYLQDKLIWITKRSVDGIKENRTYLWQTDKNGKIINVPEPGNDHFLDAARYGLENLKPKPKHMSYKPEAMMNRKYAHSNRK